MKKRSFLAEEKVLLRHVRLSHCRCQRSNIFASRPSCFKLALIFVANDGWTANSGWFFESPFSKNLFRFNQQTSV